MTSSYETQYPGCPVTAKDLDATEPAKLKRMDSKTDLGRDNCTVDWQRDPCFSLDGTRHPMSCNNSSSTGDFTLLLA